MKNIITLFVFGIFTLFLIACTLENTTKSSQITTPSSMLVPKSETVPILQSASETTVSSTKSDTAIPYIPSFTATLLQDDNSQELFTLLDWPLAPLSRDQIKSVANCDIEILSRQRYPENIEIDLLMEEYTPASACDWAVLAYAYAIKNEDDIPPALGVNAFRQAVHSNYGYAFATPIFYYYFGSMSLISGPDDLNQRISNLEISYSWVGYADPSEISYSLMINDIDTDPKIIVNPSDLNIRSDIDIELLQNLKIGFTDLLPVDKEFVLLPCTDNIPRWVVTLEFKNGTIRKLFTNSNFLFAGGPWQTEINGQYYIHYSMGLTKQLNNLISALGLPIGQPDGMHCTIFPVFEQVFPGFFPTATRDPLGDQVYTSVAETVSIRLTEAASTPPSP